MRKRYDKPTTEILHLESSNGFLKGSITTTPIKIQNVSVEDFQDGFASEGGFKEITFD